MATIYKLFTIFMSILLLTNFEVESKRNYKHSKQELKLIKNVVIDQDQCDKHEIPIVIHSAAQSSGKYFERRQTTRNTWAKEAKKYQMRPLFVMGLATDERTQEELEKEAQHFKDIIQFGFIDNYYNLTLKSLSMLRWIRKNCFTSAYVLKTGKSYDHG